MKMLPTIKLGKYDVTRLIVGGNPFCGNSHQSPQMDKEMRDYYTTQRIKKTLYDCEKFGINTIQARGDVFIMRLLNEYWNEGGKLQWIAQTASELVSIPNNVKNIASYGAIGCYHHGSKTDYLYKEGKIDSVKEILSVIRDSGMVVGLGTHDPDVVRYAEDNRFDLDFYMISFYNLSKRGEIYLPEDRETACKIIREINKPVLAFKIMAAGRNEPSEAFKFAYENIKPIDSVVVGIFTKYFPDQVKYNTILARKYSSL